MKAAVLNRCPGNLEIEDIDIDTPRPHEVLVRTTAAGLCHSDLHFLEAKYQVKCPVVLGHESAGVVETIGDQVTYVQPGDHVITCLSVFCGECEACLTGHMSLCRNPSTQRERGAESRLTRHGEPMGQFLNLSSFAEQLLVHEHALVKIDPEMPLDRAALLGCGATTGLGAAMNTAKVEPGTTVAVVGCGGVGLNVIQGAILCGAARVIAVDRLDSKLELAKTFGATDTVNATTVDPVVAVLEMSGGGVHYSFEAIGLKLAAEQAFGMLRPGGTATVIGMIPPDQSVELPGVAFLSEKRIQGSSMGSNRFRIDMPRYIDLYLQGRLKLDELVSARIRLEEINDGFAAMKTGEVARSVVIFD